MKHGLLLLVLANTTQLNRITEQFLLYWKKNNAPAILSVRSGCDLDKASTNTETSWTIKKQHIWNLYKTM